MTVRIGSNISSLIGQRQLASATDLVSRGLERLSSGLRINRASDDAAGLAVSSSLNRDARLFSVAERNANDGLSLLSIASNSLSQQSLILNRLSELAEQSANGTFSLEQRSVLNREYQTLLQEFGRLAESTSFNGLNPLLGGRGDNADSLSLQVGINGNANSILQFDTSDTGKLSGIFSRSALGDPDLNGDGSVDNDDIDLLNNSHELSDLSELFNDQLISFTITNESGEEVTVLVGLVAGSDPTTLDALFFVENEAGSYDATAASVSKFTQIVSGGDGTVDFDPQTGRVVSGAVQSETVAGSTLSIDLTGLEFSSLGPSYASAIDFTGVESSERALSALDAIAQRRTELSQIAGKIGSAESRVQSALVLIISSREGLLQAASRITDVDVAFETAELTRAQILQQTATAVLAQANTQPQLALQLLSVPLNG